MTEHKSANQPAQFPIYYADNPCPWPSCGFIGAEIELLQGTGCGDSGVVLRTCVNNHHWLERPRIASDPETRKP